MVHALTKKTNKFLQMCLLNYKINSSIRTRAPHAVGLQPTPAKLPQTSSTHAHAKRARTRGISAVATIKVKI